MRVLNSLEVSTQHSPARGEASPRGWSLIRLSWGARMGAFFSTICSFLRLRKRMMDVSAPIDHVSTLGRLADRRWRNFSPSSRGPTRARAWRRRSVARPPARFLRGRASDVVLAWRTATSEVRCCSSAGVGLTGSVAGASSTVWRGYRRGTASGAGVAPTRPTTRTLALRRPSGALPKMVE
jgi:hypothetical protein